MLKLLIFLISVEQFEAVSNFMKVYNRYDLRESEKSQVSNLLLHLSDNYLYQCTTNVLYDDFFFETSIYRDVLFETMDNFRKIAITQGFIDKFDMKYLYNGTGRQPCFNFLILANDLEIILTKLDFQLNSRVILVTTLSTYQIKELVESPMGRNIQNLLIVCDPILQKEDFLAAKKKKDIIMYTHQLHADGIGSSNLKLLTAWKNNNITRPEVNLFPPKLDSGLNGHLLIVNAFEQPPYVIKRKLDNTDSRVWDGLEVRLLEMIAESLNASIVIQDTLAETEVKATDEVINTVMKGKADIAISGLYITRKYYHKVYFSVSHSQDCATFITLSSTAIPKYRAILGPFRWGVWVCVILIYMAAIVPIALSIKYSCAMFENCAEVGTMLWMVFGTFTNLFTYRGDKSWNNIKTSSTRSVIGTYWIFTIIITAAYSSSIISFITVPNYFEMANSVKDLLDEEYKIGVVDSRDWPSMFNSTADKDTDKLMKYVDIVNSSVLGLERVRTKEKYAFLNSRAYLEHSVRSNFLFRPGRKKALYHITSQCLAPFMISYAMKPKSDFLVKFDQLIQRYHENGLIDKIMKDIYWEISRTGKGSLFAGYAGLQREAPEDRQLTVDDTQGMFLLLGIGLVMAGTALLHELFVGYECNDDKSSITSRPTSIPSIILTTSENTNKLLSFTANYTRPLSVGLEKGFGRMKASLRRFSR